MILSGCCAPATVGHDAAAPPRTQRDCRLLMPAPKVYVIVTARMTALVGLKQASRPYEMLADVRCGVKTGKAQCQQMFSALPLRADIAQCSRHVRFVPMNRHAGADL